MINQISMNVDQVAGKLIKLGVAIKGIYRTDMPEVEDDCVNVTETISVQVSSYGQPYMSVTRYEEKSECFVFYPERLSLAEIVADINRAKSEE